MGDVVSIERAAVEAMLAQARAEPELECCGLLAGRAGIISQVLPAQNALRSATAYDIEARELFGLFRRIGAQGLVHLGIYHSHPRGENAPSRQDIERAYYPEAFYFILSPRPEAQQPVRAFLIAEGRFRELTIRQV